MYFVALLSSHAYDIFCLRKWRRRTFYYRDATTTLYVNSCIYSHMQQPRVRDIFVIFPHEQEWMQESIFDFNTSINVVRALALSNQAFEAFKVVKSPMGNLTLIHLHDAGEKRRAKERERYRSCTIGPQRYVTTCSAHYKRSTCKRACMQRMKNRKCGKYSTIHSIQYR